jgi:hypothetical protein
MTGFDGMRAVRIMSWVARWLECWRHDHAIRLRNAISSAGLAKRQSISTKDLFVVSQESYGFPPSQDSQDGLYYRMVQGLIDET